MYQLNTASGWATAINTERHINDGKVMTYPIKKEGTPKLHPYLLAIGNREAGDFPLALPATLLSLLQLFPSAKKELGQVCLIFKEEIFLSAGKLICMAVAPQPSLLGKQLMLRKGHIAALWLPSEQPNFQDLINPP